MRKLLSRVATAFALLAPILGAHAQQALPYGLKPGKPAKREPSAIPPAMAAKIQTVR